jgi:hypothetical protein
MNEMRGDKKTGENNTGEGTNEAEDKQNHELTVAQRAALDRLRAAAPRSG